MTDTATLIAQLRVLAHLTRAEAQVARLRHSQATADDVRDVLRRAATDADERARRIADALRDLGALPDLVGPVLGRVAALVRGAVEQAQPLDEALLGDLALEHQLQDRARYLGALAEAAGLPAVRRLADDLDTAHAAAAAWVHQVLTDLAGGRAALGPSPLQQVAAQVARTANAPGRAALDEAGSAVRDTVDRALDTAGQTAGAVGHAAGEARSAVEDYAGRAARLGAETVDTTLTAGRDALTTGRDAAGTLARRLTGAASSDTASPDTGTAPAPEPAAPPVPGFADLPAHAAIAALRTLDDPRDVAVVVAAEQAQRNRPAVLAAARIRAAAVEGRRAPA